MFAALADDIEFRRALPVGVDLSDPDVIGGEVEATVAALHAAIDRLDRDAIARGVGRQLAAATRPAPLAPLQQFTAAATLGARTPVRLRRGLRLTLRAADDHLVIGLFDKDLRLPTAVAEAVHAATSGKSVTADCLPGVETAEGVALLRPLLAEPLLCQAQRDCAGIPLRGSSGRAR
jgi:hypothetical protein